MSDRRKRNDILFEPGTQLVKHPGGRPRTYEEPRDKITLFLRRSALRSLEQIKVDERRRLERAGDPRPKAVTVTSLIADAIDSYIAAHRKAKS